MDLFQSCTSSQITVLPSNCCYDFYHHRSVSLFLYSFISVFFSFSDVIFMIYCWLLSNQWIYLELFFHLSIKQSLWCFQFWVTNKDVTNILVKSFCGQMFLYLIFIFLDKYLEESENEGPQSCLTLCNPMDSSIHGIFQTSILEWVAISFSKYLERNYYIIGCVYI